MVSTTLRLRPGERCALDRAEDAGYLWGSTPGAVTVWASWCRSRVLPVVVV